MHSPQAPYFFIFFSNMCTYICVNLPQAGCTLNLREEATETFTTTNL